MTPDQIALALVLAGQVPGAPGGGPSGAPSGLSAVVRPWPHGVRFTWTNGDPTAYTRIYLDGVQQAPAANPGATTIDLGQNQWGNPEDPANPVTFTARHYKDGQESADSNGVVVNIGGESA